MPSALFGGITIAGTQAYLDSITLVIFWRSELVFLFFFFLQCLIITSYMR